MKQTVKLIPLGGRLSQTQHILVAQRRKAWRFWCGRQEEFIPSLAEGTCTGLAPRSKVPWLTMFARDKLFLIGKLGAGDRS